MNPVKLIMETFPEVKWTGGSHMHRSVAAIDHIPIPFDQPRMILKVLMDKGVGGYIWDSLLRRFSSMEWLIDRQEFNDLFLLDVSHMLEGLGPLGTPGMITNPTTGNRFHRVAVLSPIVGGVRFWVSHYSKKRVQIGYRFRLVVVASDKEEEEAREESKQRSGMLQSATQSLHDSIMEVAEPPKEAVSAVEHFTTLLQE